MSKKARLLVTPRSVVLSHLETMFDVAMAKHYALTTGHTLKVRTPGNAETFLEDVRKSKNNSKIVFYNAEDGLAGLIQQTGNLGDWAMQQKRNTTHHSETLKKCLGIDSVYTNHLEPYRNTIEENIHKILRAEKNQQSKAHKIVDVVARMISEVVPPLPKPTLNGHVVVPNPAA